MGTWLSGKRFPISFAPRWGSHSRFVYNDRKNRYEVWVWHYGDAREFDSWMLDYAFPIRQFKESFMGGIHSLAPGGLISEKFWASNGNPAPADGNFLQSNYWIGGLNLRCLGAADNDWVAIHMGDNYPVTLRRSPHLRLFVAHVMAVIPQVFSVIGLIGSSNLETGNDNPWTVPYDGIWVEYDSSVDDNFRFVTSKDGTQTVTSFVPPVFPNEWYTQVGADGTSVRFLIDGVIIAEHDTNLPIPERLKLLFMIGRHGAAVSEKDCYIQEVNLMFDM